MEAIRDAIMKYRKILMVLVLGAVSVSVGVFFWENHKDKLLMEDNDLIYKALSSSEGGNIEDLKKVSDNTKGIIANIAKFRLASHYVKNNELALAKEMYGSIAADSTLVPELRELAKYFSAVIALESTEGKNDESEDVLVKLAADRGGIYRSSAKEALVAVRLIDKDVEAAVWIMQEIVGDPAVTPLIRSNAENLLRVYGGK